MLSDKSNRPTILIVDDSPTNIKILGESLKSIYKVRLATNGKKALNIAQSDNPPDLILLDIIMPNMDGYEVCTKLKSEPSTMNIPVIFVTAKDAEEDETTGLTLGAVDYITKPFSLPIIHARLKTHIELKKHRDILVNLSSLDGLTGIANRRRFDELCEIEWARATRDVKPISLIMVDIDYFKQFNDKLGHVAGDDCLRQVAKILTGSVNRLTDLVARYGGEEFVILLSGTDNEGALQIANNFKNYLAEAQIEHPGSAIDEFLTCSMGVATLTPETGQNHLKLIEAADKQLYHAKESGRNCILTQRQ